MKICVKIFVMLSRPICMDLELSATSHPIQIGIDIDTNTLMHIFVLSHCSLIKASRYCVYFLYRQSIIP